jgi:hypothetical protein
MWKVPGRTYVYIVRSHGQTRPNGAAFKMRFFWQASYVRHDSANGHTPKGRRPATPAAT